MPLLPIALWHRLRFLNNEISKHIHVYMLLPELSYCRQTSNLGPTETLMLCFRASEAGNPPRGKARGQPQRHQGGLGTALTEEHLPGLPHGQQPQRQPHSQAAPGSGFKKGILSFFPSHQAQSITRGDITEQASRSLLPYPRCFPCLFSFPDNFSNHNNFSTKQKQLGSGPMLCFHLPARRFLQEPRGLHLLPSWSVSGPE